MCNLCSVNYLGEEKKLVHQDCVQSPESGEVGDQENNLERDISPSLQAASEDEEIKSTHRSSTRA